MRMRCLIIACCLPVMGSAAAARAPQAVASAVPPEACQSAEPSLAELARLLAPGGEPVRAALAALAGSADAGQVRCGLAGLAALGDARAVPALALALARPDLRDRTHLVARWAAFLAGGPDPGLGAAMSPVITALEDAATWEAAGLDGILLLGEIDHPAARDRLLRELDAARDDAALDTVVHALARQGDARPAARLAVLGDEAARAKSGNATPEQARRLGEVAFYQMALAVESVDAGLATLDTIALRDQEWSAAWAVHTLCARAVRRPEQQATIDAHRQALAAELDRRGVTWRAPQGPFGCAGER
jgi:hypothetical protein